MLDAGSACSKGTYRSEHVVVERSQERREAVKHFGFGPHKGKVGQDLKHSVHPTYID